MLVWVASALTQAQAWGVTFRTWSLGTYNATVSFDSTNSGSKIGLSIQPPTSTWTTPYNQSGIFLTTSLRYGSTVSLYSLSFNNVYPAGRSQASGSRAPFDNLDITVEFPFLALGGTGASPETVCLNVQYGMRLAFLPYSSITNPLGTKVLLASSQTWNIGDPYNTTRGAMVSGDNANVPLRVENQLPITRKALTINSVNFSTAIDINQISGALLDVGPGIDVAKRGNGFLALDYSPAVKTGVASSYVFDGKITINGGSVYLGDNFLKATSGTGPSVEFVTLSGNSAPKLIVTGTNSIAGFSDPAAIGVVTSEWNTLSTESGTLVFDVGSKNLLAINTLFRDGIDGSPLALIKKGTGTLELINDGNAFSGGLSLQGGTALLSVGGGFDQSGSLIGPIGSGELLLDGGTAGVTIVAGTGTLFNQVTLQSSTASFINPAKVNIHGITSGDVLTLAGIVRLKNADTDVVQSGVGITSGSSSLNVPSTSGLKIAQPVSGTGIPPGAVVVSLPTATRVVISKASTMSGNVTVTFKAVTNPTVEVSVETPLVLTDSIQVSGTLVMSGGSSLTLGPSTSGAAPWDVGNFILKDGTLNLNQDAFGGISTISGTASAKRNITTSKGAIVTRPYGSAPSAWAGNFAFNGNGNKLELVSADPQSDTAVALDGSVSITVESGTLAFGNIQRATTAASASLTKSGAGLMLFEGGIGAGSLALSLLDIQEGPVEFGSQGLLFLNGNLNTGATSFPSLVVDSGLQLEVTGQSSGSGFIKNGPGALVLSGSVTTGQTFSVNEGTLGLNYSESSTLRASTAPTATLVLKSDAPVAFESGSKVQGDLIISGSSLVDLSALGSASFRLTVNGGTVDLAGVSRELSTLNVLSGSLVSSKNLAKITFTQRGVPSIALVGGTGILHQSTFNSKLAPKITRPPATAFVPVGSKAQFSVSASAGSDVSYQWYKEGVAISNATASTLSLDKATLSDIGSYQVVVKNTYGIVLSDSTRLDLMLPPAITSQPQGGAILLEDAPISFMVVASGTQPLSYQWRFNGVEIPGANSQAYSIAKARVADSGAYSVLVTNPYGRVLSVNALLRVDQIPTILQPPRDTTVLSGGSVTFSVVATGSPTPSYQWLKNGVEIPGATSSTFSLASVAADVPIRQYPWAIGEIYTHPSNSSADAGAYSVVAANVAGNTVSAIATLQVATPLQITGQPLSKGVKIGGSYTLSVSAKAGDWASLQWRKNGVDIPGANFPDYTIPSAALSDAGVYSVWITDPSGSLISEDAEVIVGNPPSITSQPQSQSAFVGESLSLSASARGDEPLFYQWKKDGVNIQGGTSATLALRPLKSGDFGDYTLSVSNRVGQILTEPASLSVLHKPTIATQPETTVSIVGGSASFSVGVEGTPPFTFQWRKNGVPIAGGTSAILNLVALSLADSANYSVRVENQGGGVLSETALLTVSASPRTVWTTLAGLGGPFGSADGVGEKALFETLGAMTQDSSGNLYVVDGATTIRRINPQGAVTTLIKLPKDAVAKDGPASSASCISINALAIDSAGAIYFADSGGIRKAALSGGTWMVTTLAGAPGQFGYADGTGESARFGETISGLALDKDGNVYISDSQYRVIRKMTPSGSVSTFAGSPYTKPAHKDGKGTDAAFMEPARIAFDNSENLWVVDRLGKTVRSINAAGYVRTPIGSPEVGGVEDGIGDKARFFSPYTLAGDGKNIYVGDGGALRVIDTDTNRVTTLAGEVNEGGLCVSGTGTAARFSSLSGMAVDGLGNVFVADGGSGLIRKVSPERVVTIFAGGGGSFGQSDGKGSAARFSFPCAVASDASGNLFVVDTGNHTLRKITPSGVTSLLAGCPGEAGSADGTGGAARFNQPSGLVVDANGNIFVCEYANHTIRKISPTGVVTTLAGSPGVKGTTDGKGNAARFNGPLAVALDSQGNLLIADCYNHTIRRVTMKGDVSTVAGVPGKPGDADGEANVAQFSWPMAVAVDEEGNLLVGAGNLIRRIGLNGKVSTLVGKRDSWSIQDGPLSDASFSNILSLGIDEAGNVFVLGLSSLRMISADGYVGTLTNFAPTSTNSSRSSYKDGPGNIVQFANPYGLCLDPSGRVYIADTGNNAIRLGVISPIITQQPKSVRINTAESASLRVQCGGTGPFSYQWRKSGIAVPGATSSTYTLASAHYGDSGSYDCVVSNSLGSDTSDPANLIVTAEPQIVIQPASRMANLGSAFSLSVDANGPGPLRYEWTKDGAPLPGGDSAVLWIPQVQPTDAGRYQVRVSNLFGQVTSETSQVSVSNEPGVQVQRERAQSYNVIAGGGSSLRLTLPPSAQSKLTYQLIALNDPSKVLSKGNVPADGVLNVSLRAISKDGDYTVRFVKQTDAGEQIVGECAPFHGFIRAWTDISGTYEGLLSPVPPVEGDAIQLDDGRLYRGFVSINITKTGSCSGKVLYNEWLPAERGTEPSGVYLPVTRTFSGKLEPHNQDPSLWRAHFKLGVGAQAGREEIDIQVDLSGEAPLLSALVRDLISIGGGPSGYCSVLQDCPRRLPFPTNAIPSDLAALPGRYTLVSDVYKDAPLPAYALVQVLPSMTVMWTSRLPGAPGSGSGNLKIKDTTHMECPFYEGRLSSIQGNYTSRSLLGTLEFSYQNQTWNTSFENALLEAHGSRFQISGTTQKSYRLGNDSWSGIERLSFHGLGVRWSGNTGASALSNIPGAATLMLNVADPLSPTLACRFNVATSGMLSSIVPNDPAATRFALKLDKARGEFTGSYLLNNQRRSIYGCVATIPTKDSAPGTFIAAGWIEIPSTTGVEMVRLRIVTGD